MPLCTALFTMLKLEQMGANGHNQGGAAVGERGAATDAPPPRLLSTGLQLRPLDIA